MANNKGKIYFTPKEQFLLNELPEGAVVEFGQLRELNREKRICSAKNLPLLVASLAGKNGIFRIKKGKYIVNKGKPVDAFIIGPELFHGYNAFSSALYLHGWKTEAPLTYYVACVKGAGRRRIGRLSFVSVSMAAAAVGDIYVGKYRVSSKAKTLFDCVLFPKYSGGIGGILQALTLAELGKGDWEEFVSYLHLAGNSDLQRMGFLLEKGGAAPRNVIGAIRRLLKRPARIRLEPEFPAGGKPDKKWNVVQNIPLG